MRSFLADNGNMLNAMYHFLQMALNRHGDMHNSAIAQPHKASSTSKATPSNPYQLTTLCPVPTMMRQVEM